MFWNAMNSAAGTALAAAPAGLPPERAASAEQAAMPG